MHACNRRTDGQNYDSQDRPRICSRGRKEARNQAHELERMRMEQYRLDLELRFKTKSSQKDACESDEENPMTTGRASSYTGITKEPKVACFDETKDDIHAFLHKFEICAESQKWKVEQCAVYLSALLKCHALEV